MHTTDDVTTRSYMYYGPATVIVFQMYCVSAGYRILESMLLQHTISAVYASFIITYRKARRDCTQLKKKINIILFLSKRLKNYTIYSVVRYLSHNYALVISRYTYKIEGEYVYASITKMDHRLE